MMIRMRTTMISVVKLDCEDDNENDDQYKCIINLPICISHVDDDEEDGNGDGE